MAAATVPDTVQEKQADNPIVHQESHIDVPKDLASQAIAKGQGLSGFETLSLWQTFAKFKVNCLICFVVTLSAATDGYQIGLIGNIIANKGFVEKFATQVDAAGNPALASPIISGWNSIGSCGQIIGMCTLPFFSDKFGRKLAMFVYCFLLAISVLIECVATNWQVWLIGKLFGGIGVGCLQCTVPTYVAEVAPVRARGAMLSTYTFWWITGQFFAPVALQVMYERHPDNYLTPIYTQWSQIGLMAIIYLLVPESPAWCASRGHADRAKRALKRIHCDVPDYDVEHQYNLLVLNIEHERAVAAEQKKEHWTAIFRGRDGLRTVISCWPLMTQQFMGLGVFYGYATYFYQQAGIEDPFKITCISSGINIAATIVFIWVADVYGRRYLCCAGSTLSWICAVMVGILGVAPKVGASYDLLVLFNVLWNLGLMANNSAGTAYLAETSQQRLRHHTSGFAFASTCVVGIVMGSILPFMINANEWNWGLKTAWLFVGLGLPFIVAMWFLLPEMKGRSSAEIDELFEQKVKPWRFSKTVTATQALVQPNLSEF